MGVDEMSQEEVDEMNAIFRRHQTETALAGFMVGFLTGVVAAFLFLVL